LDSLAGFKIPEFLKKAQPSWFYRVLGFWGKTQVFLEKAKPDEFGVII